MLDLRTNTIAQLTAHDATEEMSGSVVSLEQNSGAQPATDPSGRNKLDETLLDLSHLPDLPGCPRH